MTPRSDPHTADEENLAANTDRELWREGDGDGDGMSYYEPSIHVTAQGHIGINVGGNVYERTLREWHAAVAAEARVTQLAEKLTKWADQLQFDADTQQAISLTGGDDYGTADEYRNEANRNGTLAARLREIAALGVVADGGGGRDD